MKFKKEQKQEDEFLYKAALGDRAGIEYLVNTYRDFAYTIAFGIVSNHEDAEEVVQDSFMKAFAALDKFRKASKFSTWLYRIVYHTALTKIQYKKTHQSGFRPVLEEDAVPAEDHSWDMLKKAEQKRYVELALARLSSEDRLVITLHYIGEKSIAEICTITGNKRSAVKMRLLRARKQLEATLELLLKQEKRNLL